MSVYPLFEPVRIQFAPLDNCGVCGDLELNEDLSVCRCGSRVCPACVCHCVQELTPESILDSAPSLFAGVLKACGHLRQEYFVSTLTDQVGGLLYWTGDVSYLFPNEPRLHELFRKQIPLALQPAQKAREMEAVLQGQIGYSVAESTLVSEWNVTTIPFVAVDGLHYIINFYSSSPSAASRRS